jgi:hypothetical protein
VAFAMRQISIWFLAAAFRISIDALLDPEQRGCLRWRCGTCPRGRSHTTATLIIKGCCQTAASRHRDYDDTASIRLIMVKGPRIMSIQDHCGSWESEVGILKNLDGNLDSEFWTIPSNASLSLEAVWIYPSLHQSSGFGSNLHRLARTVG